MPAVPLPRDAAALQLPSPALALRSLVPRLSTVLSRRSILAVRASTPSDSLRDSLTLAPRAITGIIPTYYNLGGPTAGATVGIVLGSVAGLFLIIWLFYSLSKTSSGAAITGEEEIVVRRRRSRSPHSRRSRRSTRTEVREISRSPRRREHVIVEERRERPRSVLVEERVRVPGDDIVEVIEEHSDIRPPRKERSRRNSGYRY